MKIYICDKKVFLLRNKAVAFLNGLTSNEIIKPHNAFLNIHGRIVATFDQNKLNEDNVVILLEPLFVDRLWTHIDRYIKLSGVQVEPLIRKCYFDLEDTLPVRDGDFIFPQNKGKVLATEKVLETNVSEEQFRLFRLRHHIPAQGIDYDEDFLLNVSVKDYVSFSKGCYLGQEPISKVYNRSSPSWKLVVRAEDECTAEEKAKMTSKANDPQTGKVIGFVFVRTQPNIKSV